MTYQPGLTCTRRLDWDSGHRVLGHGGKCCNVHGHRYSAEITCAAMLDDLGMVIDFGKIKELVGTWIDDNWDHTMIFNTDDPLVPAFRGELAARINGKVPGCHKPAFILPANPTAEVMASFLFHKAMELLSPFHIKVTHVRIYETPNCWADCFNQENK